MINKDIYIAGETFARIPVHNRKTPLNREKYTYFLSDMKLVSVSTNKKNNLGNKSNRVLGKLELNILFPYSVINSETMAIAKYVAIQGNSFL
jgi:hypothetical protein